MAPTYRHQAGGAAGGRPSRRAPRFRPPLPTRDRRALAALLCCLGTASAAGAAAPALTPPAPAVVEEARSLVEAMKAAERGPYSRLRWYCKDGTVLPPTPYGCRDHGGGRQHAEYSPERRRLAELGWSVGTVVAALTWEELTRGERRERLRELPLERYLVDVDDGWVLRRARYYRGRVQVEDEEAAGRDLLVRLLSRPEWVADNYLLAREAVRSLPHHGGTDRTRTIRRISQEIAEKDPGFERLRIKIHTTPGPEDAAATRAWIEAARRRGAPAAVVDAAESLADELEALYGRPQNRLRELRRPLARLPGGDEVDELLSAAGDAPLDRVAALSAALRRVREQVSGSSAGVANLAWMDLSLALEGEVLTAAFAALESERPSRRDLLRLSRALLDAVFGGGLHAERESAALTRPLDALLAAAEPPTADLLAAVRGLRRAAPWGLSTVRFTFAEPLVRYVALEPRAGRFADDLVRGSALLPLAEATTRLAADADRLSGIVHRAFGRTYGGMLALNPGVAVGRLRVVANGELARGGAKLGREEIVVLPTTVSELDPVAGILTLAEGNLLSHVQILARNLGIPNASLSPILARRLAEHAGREVLLAVGTDGSIVLEAAEDLPEEVLAAVRRPQIGPRAPGAKLDAPRPDLSVRRPLPLAELEAGLAGRVVGPKAANLGELARNFPGRVEQAVALPFAVFADHVSAGDDSPKARLDRAFARSRAGEIDDAALAAEVEAVRQAVAAVELTPELRARLLPLMEELFGPPGSYGAFVRSDTNVEDLPGFTGAGLNETVPNVVGIEPVLTAVARVWSSPFAPRAMAWRSMILNRPEEVYASALIMKSVPADKSGVLVTTDLAARGRGLTVATAWGVGGAVDGEAAETLVLRPGGGVDLVGEAKAPYRRRLRTGGGVEWVPAATGAVLTVEEQQALRRLAVDVDDRLRAAIGRDGKPLPWDIEFGFVSGKLALFQIRPLVERGQILADRMIESLHPGQPQPPARVDLDVAPAPVAEDGDDE